MRARPHLVLLLLASCATPPMIDDGAGGDAATHGNSCTSAADCDDGVFCNGAERCMPGAMGATRLGCVAASSPCMAGQTCNEAMHMCVANCAATTDADHDGHLAIACGGDDCDDTDAHRYPGNTEVCDSMHDEDCNPFTYGDRDVDVDHFVDIRCCNVEGSTSICGNDCNDMNAAVHPGASEVCNGVDDDCNGLLDGPDEDSDHDGHANDYCAGAGGTDCNDRYPDVYDGAPELCDGIDEDCSSCDETTQLCTGGHCATPTTRCGDPGSDTSEDFDQDAHAPTTATCTGGFPRDDCDDAHAAAHPGGTEVCDGVDNDCNGSVDDASITDAMCAAPSATAACARGGGSCVLRACNAGTADCDADVSNGCEATLATDPQNCGQCSVRCGAGGVCSGGLCDGVTQIMAGQRFACARRTSGAVVCWGYNRNGELGDGTMVQRSLPTLVQGIADATQIEGAAQGCAVLASGQVACWPDGMVPGITDAREVVEGGFGFACARRATGAVSCWGDNSYGALGDGTTTSSDTPVAVVGLPDAIGLAADAASVCAARADGRVYCWGDMWGSNTPTTPLTGPTAVTEMTGGYNAVCMRGGDNVWCAGWNDRGQLGDVAAGDTFDVAVLVPGLLTGHTTEHITQISAGGTHACAVRSGGTVVCWGDNAEGELGIGASDGAAHAPTTVLGISDAVEVRVSKTLPGLNASFTCVRRASGAVLCWGSGANGELGDGTSPAAVRDAPGPSVSIGSSLPTTGNALSCVRQPSGGAACWGSNVYGRLGTGGPGGSRTSAAPVSMLGDAVALSSLGATCALRASGVVDCWGQGDTLQDGAVMSRTPVPVPGLTGMLDVRTQRTTTCAISTAHQVLCFGDNTHGQLGDGSTTSRATPMPVSGITDAVEIAVGLWHACARRASGDVVCWGDNSRGQLGDGTNTNALTPVTALIQDVAQIAAGILYTCARRSDGRVFCWGADAFGQLGDGGHGASSHPVQAIGITSAVEISLGASTTYARMRDGTVLAWGVNSAGQIGDGTTIDRHSPTMVLGITDATWIAAGGANACVQRATGQILCWGENSDGQVGNGTLQTPVSSPTPVLGL